MTSTSAHFFVCHSTVSGRKWNAPVLDSVERSPRSCACPSPDGELLRPNFSLSSKLRLGGVRHSFHRLHSGSGLESSAPGVSQFSPGYSSGFKKASCTRCGLGTGPSTSVEANSVSSSLSKEENSSNNASGSASDPSVLAPKPPQMPSGGAQLAGKPVFQINRPAPIPPTRPVSVQTGNSNGNSAPKNDSYRPNAWRPGQNGNGNGNSKFVYKPKSNREEASATKASESAEETSDKVIMSLKEILEKAERMGSKTDNSDPFFQKEARGVGDEPKSDSVRIFTSDDLNEVSESQSTSVSGNEKTSEEAMLEVQQILDEVAEERAKLKDQTSQDAGEFFVWNNETIDNALTSSGESVKDEAVDEALENIVTLHKTMANSLTTNATTDSSLELKPESLTPEPSKAEPVLETPSQNGVVQETTSVEKSIPGQNANQAVRSLGKPDLPLASPPLSPPTPLPPSPPLTRPNPSFSSTPQNSRFRKNEKPITANADRWERNSSSVYRPPKPQTQEPPTGESITITTASEGDVEAERQEEEEEEEVIVRPKPTRIERPAKPASAPPQLSRQPSPSASFITAPYKPNAPNSEESATGPIALSKPSIPSPATSPSPTARKGPILLDTGRIVRPSNPSTSAASPPELAVAAPAKPGKAISRPKDSWKKKDAEKDGIKSKKGAKGEFGDERDVQKRGKRESKAGRKAARLEAAKANAPVRVEILEVGKQGMSVQELAGLLAINDSDVIKTLFIKGVVTTVNQTLDEDTVRIVCNEYGVEVIEAGTVRIEDMAKKDREFLEEEDLDNLILRPPVVTIMGHVDHGKTSLLDYIRKSKVVEGEAGGITQGIGAYSVKVDVGGEEQTCVFLDTPGHEAFSAMRARGAKVTDIAIIVVAADDGVRPQTLEAIAHAKAANVPIVIAINKIDKEGANPDKVMQELAANNLMPEEWGGDTPMVQVSAKAGINIESLLETVVLVAEIQDLRANPDRLAVGTVIEANLDKFKGPVATLLVQNGTLKKGDVVLCGESYGRVRALTDDSGNKPESAGPSMAVEVLGLSSVPLAGDEFEVIDSIDEAKEKAAANAERLRSQRLAAQGGEGRVTLASLAATMAADKASDSVEHHTLNIVLKVDAQGSVEAIREALSSLPQDTVRLRFLLQGTGDVSSSDIDLASASEAIVLGFNVAFPTSVESHAQARGVEVRNYRVIYDLVDDMRKAMEGMLESVDERTPLGKAEVRQVFGSGSSKVAGCMVLEGKLVKGCSVSVNRGKNEVFVGTLTSLRRVKENAKEIVAGLECGVGVEGFDGWSDGDIIEAFELVSKSRSLEEASKAASVVLAAKAEILSGSSSE